MHRTSWIIPFGLLLGLLGGCARNSCFDIDCDFGPAYRVEKRKPSVANHQLVQHSVGAVEPQGADERRDDKQPDKPATEAKKNGGMEEPSKNGNGKKNDKPPEHIRDNSMLIEEAANQEPGIVQHIFNWVNGWDRNHQGRSRDFLAAYTMELPLGSQTHQFSFTVPFLTAYVRHEGMPAMQGGDIGDIFLNYRYQLMADDELVWISPRFSLILPTGDERFGFGNGKLGYLFNLPVSKYMDSFDFHFNAGASYTPDVAAYLENGSRSPRHDLRTYLLGGSAFWKPAVNFHLFVEVLALWMDEIDELGRRDRATQVFINPGLRFAIIQDPLEWVLGVGVPVGVTKDSPDIGVFAYMSIEHPFRKLENGNGE
jgi:hypothetical protein